MRIGVLLPAHNAEATVREAVQSVLDQTHRDFELLAIDDGSTDGTRAILDQFAAHDPRVRVVAHPNWGKSRSLNHGLALATAEWIAIMHADDVMMPTRLERQSAFIHAHPGVAVASCFVYNIDGVGRIIGRTESDLLTPDDFRRYVSTNRIIGFHHPGVIMRRKVALSVGGYRPEFPVREDIDLWNRIAERGHLILVQPEYLLKYRIHPGASSVRNMATGNLYTRWVAGQMRCRRAGLPEPSLEEFVAFERQRPWPARLGRLRRDCAQTLYKSAVASYSDRRYGRLLLALSGSLVLDPTFASRLVWGKYLRFKLRRSGMAAGGAASAGRDTGAGGCHA
jgi:glycosyltransferase involved in cell wall biosynthesis